MVKRTFGRGVPTMAHAALLAALATVMHCVESMLPPLIAGVPVRLGLANIFTLIAIMRIGGGYAITVSVVRCLAGTLVSGSVSSLCYSLTGALLACLTMLMLEPLRRADRLSPIGVSAAGAFMFNAGQLAVGLFVVGRAMLCYFPVMSLLSLPTGVFTGAAAYYLNEGLNKLYHV